MKKILLISTAGAMFFSFSGNETQNQIQESQVQKSDVQIAQQSNRKITIGVALYDEQDAFIKLIKSGIESHKKAIKGTIPNTQIDIQYADGKRNQEIQAQQVSAFITQGVNILCVNMVDRTSANGIIQQAKAANIPIVFFNRQPTDNDMNKWDKLYYVGADPEQSGVIQATIVADYWNANMSVVDKNKDGILQYVILRGENGHQDAILRTKAVKDYFISKKVSVDLLAEDTANWNRADAKVKTSSYFNTYGDKIEAILANNDEMALGAIDVILTMKKNTIVAGIDATAQARDAVKSGFMIGTVVNDAKTQGKDILTIATSLATNKDPTDDVSTLQDRFDMVPYQAYKK